jgi:molybdate transport system ATP-binding protein
MLNLDIVYSIGSFELEAKHEFQHGITGLFGASGSGKTTLLNLISGFLAPTEGKIFLNDQVLFDSAVKTNLSPNLRRIGTVFQDGRLFPHLSVENNFMYGYKLLADSQRVVKPEEVIHLLEINGLLNKYPHELSGGEAQRVALARALLMSPNLLLMDEPLASLDSSLKQQILPYLKKIEEELAIPMIYVSHDINEINFLTTKVFTIRNGQLLGN